MESAFYKENKRGYKFSLSKEDGIERGCPAGHELVLSAVLLKNGAHLVDFENSSAAPFFFIVKLTSNLTGKEVSAWSV